MSRFTADVYQNEYLPTGGSEVNAIITVTATEAGARMGVPQAAEVVIVDTSGSMAYPRTKLKSARTATAAAVECIRDGVAFAVIAGSDYGSVLYPRDGGLAISSPETRAEAVRAASYLRADGGTAIGSWLTLACEQFETTSDRICHAILLTDGANEHETAEELDSVLNECEGRFQCDCRGVGTDWEVSELRRIASKLLGTVDIIAEPENLAADFRSMIENAMGKATGQVSLRLWTPQGASVRFIRQVAPTVEELTDRAAAAGPLAADYPTGTWGAESRDYHVCIDVPPRSLGDEMLAGRISLIEDDEVIAQGLVKAIWTEDQQLSTRMSREVAHYTGQVELAECIQSGLEARKAGDQATATFKLGRAVQLASESGNDGTLKLLANVVDVDDPRTGTIRLRRDVADADEMALDTRSTKTVRVGPAG
jgi:von Willebrand factor type A C-terminal domain/von Willebrand factor type A domain